MWSRLHRVPQSPAKLNSPGRFHVVHERLDDDAFAIELMEGTKVDTRIAVAPKHPLTDPIFDDEAGFPLAFTKLAYTHAADAFVKWRDGSGRLPLQLRSADRLYLFGGR